MQFVSGTHAISSVLFGILRPGDVMLSLTGQPYDTLEEVIGIRGRGKGSLKNFDIEYKQINICENFDSFEEKIDAVFARLFLAEKAAVRMQFVSGTHAISSVLFGILRPGDVMLSLTGLSLIHI